MISIFAKQAFLNTAPGTPFVSKEVSYHGRGHMQRVSSIIRGDQIADQIGAKYNPESGYENDVCIYVKPYVAKGSDFKFEGRKAYIDIIDGHNLAHLAQKHPEVGVIVCSQADYQIMKNELKNEVVLIPQHHCNFERIKRVRNKITKIGVIGVNAAFDFLPINLEADLQSRGMELVKFSKFFTRQDIIDFYLNIDLQIVWRPYKKILSNPLKIVNAASFGVPTVALAEEAFREVAVACRVVHDYEELLGQISDLRNNTVYYNGIVKKGLEVSEKYHIENIGELYKKLDK